MYSIVIPIFNEEENIVNLLNEIFTSLKEFKNYEIILIDDSSTDNTLDLLNIYFSNPHIKVLKNLKNQGQSFSINKGIKESLFDTIITIDGDGQNVPTDIPQLILEFNKDKNIKLVGGIRIKRKDSIVKIVTSKIANEIRSFILSDDCKDTGCSLKIFDKKIFLTFPFFDGIHRFMPALFKGYGYKTKFINVQHRKRKFGQSKYGTFNRLFRGINDIIKVKKILKNK
tara:strand:+ start:117 stop:797 length:681 start_codon:yes stop_codon:yes gene_type:complete